MSRYKKIERFGGHYVKEIIGHEVVKKNLMTKDWYEALLFFFGKSFNRGRRDEISAVFAKRSIATLEQFGIREKFPHFRKPSLERRLRENRVNNHVDRRMVVETLVYLKRLNDYNIVKYSVAQIKKGKSDEVFENLQKIFGIGDKLTGLFLRDLVFVYQLEKYLKEDELKYFQPIDTWVRQVSIKLNIIGENEHKIEDIKEKIIERCGKQSISSLLFNAGAWYLGAFSFEIALDNL